MAALRIEAADDTPLVILDKEKKQFEIKGKSMPEDVIDFYQPVLDWLKNYQLEPLQKTEFNFKLVYFNTASSKLILDVLMLFEEIQEAGSDVVIHWHSPKKDEDMHEAGEEYSDMVELKFEFHSY